MQYKIGDILYYNGPAVEWNGKRFKYTGVNDWGSITGVLIDDVTRGYFKGDIVSFQKNSVKLYKPKLTRKSISWL